MRRNPQSRLDGDAADGPPSRAFRVFLLAFGVSSFGDGLTVVGLPLLAVALTQSTAAVAGLAVAVGLPWLLFALPLGVLVDRADRLSLMRTINVARLALMAALAVIVALDLQELWMLYLVAFCLTSAEIAYDNAAQTVTPALTTPATLTAANGKLTATETLLNSLIGPALAGVLFAATAFLPFAINALTFLVSLPLLAVISSMAHVGPDRTVRPKEPAHFWADLLTGLRYVRANGFLRMLAALLAVTNLAWGAVFAVFVLYARDELGVGPIGYSIILAIGAIGGAAGGLLAERIVTALGRPLAFVIAYIGLGVFAVLLGLTSVPGVATAVFGAGYLCATVWTVNSVSARQLVVPGQLLGRVNSFFRLVGWGSMPLGALVAAALGDALGLHRLLIGAGAVQLVAAGLALPGLYRSAVARGLGHDGRLGDVSQTSSATE